MSTTVGTREKSPKCPSTAEQIQNMCGLAIQFSSVQFSQFSCSVMSDSLWSHESQHARPPCPSPTPRVHSDSRPSSQWYRPAISSSVVPFSFCPQSLPASGSFPMSQLFAWGGQSTGVSALASFLPKKSQGWSPSEWTGWIEPFNFSFFGISDWGIDLGYCDIEWFALEMNQDYSLIFEIFLHPSTAFWILLLTMRAAPFLLRDCCPQ